MLLAAIAKSSLYLAQKLSSKQAIRLAHFVGKLMYLLNVDAAKVSRVNISTCFPSWDEQAVGGAVQESLTQMALLMFEMAQMAHWPQEKLLDQIDEVIGEPILSTAHASEQGVLLLVPHYGNWEILCAYLGVHYSVAALYDPPKMQSLEPVVRQARQKYQGQMFPIDTAGMRGMLKVLRAGQLVAILPDQVPERESGIYVDFFKQPALTMSLTHRLISKNKPKVLIGSVERVLKEDGLGYILRFEEPEPQVYAESAQESLAAINASIEAVILRAPSQYQWEYKRFKRPPNEYGSNIYRRQ